MNASVDTFLPLTIDFAVVAAGVRIESLRVGHRHAAGVALVANAGGAVALAIWHAGCTVVHEGVRGEDQLDLPVAISAREELSLEAAMEGHVLVLDQYAALVAHVARRRAGILIVMAIVLDCQSLCGRLPVAADGELLGVVTGPDLDLVDIAVAETSILHRGSEGLSVTVVTLTAEEEILFSSNEYLKVCNKVLRKITTSKVSLDLGEDGSK